MGMEKPRRTKALKNNLGEGDRFTAKPAPEPGCSALGAWRFQRFASDLVTVQARKAETVDQLVCLPAFKAFALIDAAGDRATYRFLEFFTAQIRNPHNFITCS